MLLRDCAALLLCAGCAGAVQASVQVTPAPPAPTVAPEPTPASPPTPADEDGDGILAGDKCPNEKETVNGFEDADGCPDEVPKFFVKDDVITYEGAFEFGLLGGLKNSSQPTIDGIAALLQGDATVELVDVGAFVVEGTDNDDKSTKRAEAVVKALVKAGVEAKRLRASGYGKRCAEGGSRVDLKVVRRGGAETGVTLCGR